MKNIYDIFSVQGKRVLITGAANGNGKEISKAFGRAGSKLFLVDIDNNNLEIVANTIEKECNSVVERAKVDLSNPQEVDKFLAKNVNFDVVINNAGITKDNLLMRLSEQDFDDVINVNLKSVFNMTKAVQKTFLKQRKGSLIHMSSVVGVRGNAGQSNYSASKAGIIGFSKSIALELGSRNIRSNVIAPGFIETEMTKQLSQEIVEKWRNGIPLKRGGIPEDVANACVFLASDLSSYITGQVLNVDGGMLT